MITIPFQESKTAQMALSEAGGTIFLPSKGEPKFCFTKVSQYQRYMELINRDRKTD